MTEKISMNVNETLELDYLVEQMTDDTIDIKSEPNNVSTSINYIRKHAGVFDPPDTGSYKLDINGQNVEIQVTDIPDSVVSRTVDDGSTSDTGKHGLRINTSQEWPKFQAEISSNTGSLSTAYIHRVSDGTLLDSVDISELSSGDVVTFDNAGLSANTDYNVVADDNGNSYTYGFKGNANFPFTSSDGNLEIINGGDGEQGTEGGAPTFVTVGNINL